MEKFANFIVKNRWWVLAFWIIAAVAIVGLSPKLSSVENNNENNFLPKSSESYQALNVAKSISPQSQDATDEVVFENKSDQPLTPADQQVIGEAASAIQAQHLSHVLSITTSSEQLAPSKKIQLGAVVYSGQPNDTATIDAVKTVRSSLNEQLKGSDITANTTGEESTGYDTTNESNRALKIVSIGTLLLVLILPALIFRSPFTGLLPILSIGLVDTIASSLIADAAKLFNFSVNQQLSVIFTVVLFGIGTDYILFLLFRYRERLRSGDHSRQAVAFALSHAGTAIFSAALVVLTSFSALFFAKFGLFSSMAPGLVICVAVMMLAALTLAPALLAIIGPKVFWPSKAWKSKSLVPTFSKRVGGLIARKPAVVAGLIILVMLALSAFTLGYKSDFSSFGKPPGGTESAIGYNELVGAFPAGIINPTDVYITGNAELSTAELKPLSNELAATGGVASVLPPTIGSTGRQAFIPVILKANAYTNTAMAEVSGPINVVAHNAKIGTDKTYVGGTTAIFADIETASNRDLRVVFPIAAVFILIILTILLRSLVAPLFILLGVGLGYVATLGTTTMFFLRIGSDPGLIFFIPLFMYIFVVAIGTDYNILTITRLREEIAAGNKPRRAADLTVEHSSATVASAGLILAGTFGSLALAGVSFLTQMGVAIATGVSLAAFVIAPYLVPSVSAMIGYKIWWPSHQPTKKS
ncbi:MAG TPA: MMPL family transporter [Candidatus Binatia bacterium]|nr:MMPL family transporter [Candidatus Binatia bacterium]